MKRAMCVATAAAVLTLVGSAAWADYTLSTIAGFNGFNGSSPQSGVIRDANGDLFGTTYSGGADYGTVFEVVAGSNLISTLAVFNGSNGAGPWCDLVRDAQGNLYGTTQVGGLFGDGTVFKVAAGTNTLSTLVTFNGSNGQWPESGLTMDSSGNLYGTTVLGGAKNMGTVFKIPAGTNTLSTLVSFDGTNGNGSGGDMLLDANGNLYGTTGGGTYNDGSVFKLTPGTGSSATLSTLISFSTAGDSPLGKLAMDSKGNIYGGTWVGKIYEIPAGTNDLSLLAQLAPVGNSGGVVLDSSGNLYGITQNGGAYNGGTVFRVAADTHLVSTLVSFRGSNGLNPGGGLIIDEAGNLYGTTSLGGNPNFDGTVFVLSVPEPMSLLFLGLGAAAILCRRTRRGDSAI